MSDYNGVIRKTTAKAWLVDIDGNEQWLPKSQVKATDNHDGTFTFDVPVWLAKKKSLPVKVAPVPPTPVPPTPVPSSKYNGVNYTRQLPYYSPATYDPIAVMYITKKGARMKNYEFADVIGWEAEDRDGKVMNRVMRNWDIFELEETKSGKAYKVVARFSKSPVNNCRICNKHLDNPISVISGIGPVCSARIGVSKKDERDALKQLKSFVDEEVGYFSTYIPKVWVEHIDHNAPLTTKTAPNAVEEDFFDGDWIAQPCQGCPLRSGQGCPKKKDIRGFWVTHSNWWLADEVTNCNDFKARRSA
jgi:hypothetical protein